jgi:hypothetical protein
MNLLFAFVFSFCFGPVAANTPQKHAAVAAIDTVKTVSALKAKFLAIDAKRKTLSQYTPAEREEGKAYFAYFEGNSLKLINANSYTDSGKVDADEYVDETGVFLVYAKVSEYENLLSVNPRTKIKSMSENWYYLKNETLIKWVSGGKVVPAGSVAFKQKSASLKTELAKTRKLLSDPSKLTKMR